MTNCFSGQVSFASACRFNPGDAKHPKRQRRKQFEAACKPGKSSYLRDAQNCEGDQESPSEPAVRIAPANRPPLWHLKLSGQMNCPSGPLGYYTN